MTLGPWLWGPRADLAAFAAPAAVALLFVLAGPHITGTDGALPAWGFLLFVVAIDVAHVYATLFRTYLDREELRRRPTLYAGVPLGCLVVGAAVHAASSEWFWRVLAYAAAWHFIRQQIGWVAIYRRKSGTTSRAARLIDEAALYSATLYPLTFWHAHLPRAFAWFVPGDFASIEALSSVLPIVRAAWLASLALYLGKAAYDAFTSGRVELGKHVVVLTTFATWYVGVVATDSDFQFTAANVLVHGVPYAFLLYFYARERAAEAPSSLVGRIVRVGLVGFVGLLWVIAFAEEAIWDRLVWRAHPGLFGGSEGEPWLGPGWLGILVPLLVVPQATHYVLDAFLWRRRDTGPAQARALGLGVSAG